MRKVLILLFLMGCEGDFSPCADFSNAPADLSAPVDAAYVPSASGEAPSGKPDRCQYAECNGPLDKRVEASDPVREGAK